MDQGWVVRETDEGARASLETLDEDGHPVGAARRGEADPAHTAGDGIALRLSHSAVNYKDALALHGRPGVVRRTPLVAGIDAVGRVARSGAGLHEGDLVVVTGAGLGETRHGGLGTALRVDARDAVLVPRTFSARQAAAVGTAGVTAALAVLALREHGVEPDGGPVVVTGASGGVGSLAIALLAGLGYEVTAATGRRGEHTARLRALGAAEVVDRDDLLSSRSLGPRRWAGGVDAVGGTHLAGVLATLQDGGAVAACGLAGDSALPATVLPFILRGAALLGVNSVRLSRARRVAAWDLLAATVDAATLDGLTREVPLAEARDAAALLLEGHGTGRVVVDVQA